MHVLPRWEKYLSRVKSSTDAETIVSEFPFLKYTTRKNVVIDHEDSMNSVMAAFGVISSIFDELEGLRPFEVLTSQKNRINYMLTKQAKVIAMTCTHAAIKRQEFLDLGFSFDNILMEEAAQILDIESILPLTMQQNREDNCRLKRLILIGDHYQLPPVVKNPLLKNYCRFEQSLFTRLIRLNTPYIQLNMQGRCRPSLASLFNWRYRELDNLPQTSMGKFANANPGFAFVCQFVNVEDFLGKGESQPMPYFYQNLGEAEYIVLLYQYMRLLGYEAKKISILTTYNGQCQLLSDILHQKCAGHPLFGMPGSVSTVDKYQGQQNDFVLLSLVRTRHVGHLRDVRRLVVALSRARLGLYVFGRLNLFQQCQELKPVFDQLREKPSHLALVEGEHSEMEMTRSVYEVPLKSLHVQDISHMASIVKNMEEEWKRQNAM
jgi:intron-binding protein aquarius